MKDGASEIGRKNPKLDGKIRNCKDASKISRNSKTGEAVRNWTEASQIRQKRPKSDESFKIVKKGLKSDCTVQNRANASMYDEAVRNWADLIVMDPRSVFYLR